MQLPGESHGLLAGARLRRHLDTAEFADQPPEALARGRLVINDQNALRHSDRLRSAASTCGKRSRTTYSSPIRLASTEERPG